MMRKTGTEMLGEAEYAWFLLERIEDSINQISDYVQVDEMNLKVYSRQMALKLYEVGTLVEAMMKRMVNDDVLDSFPNLADDLCDARGQSEHLPTIRSYRNVLERVFALSGKTINFRLFTFSRNLQPFASFASEKDISPEWWDAYNLVKHDFFLNLSEATFERLIEGAGALFLLTVLCRLHWPVLLLHNRLVTGSLREGKLIEDRIPYDQEKLWKKLYEIFLPHLGITMPDYGAPIEILARSRLFFSVLAHWEPRK